LLEDNFAANLQKVKEDWRELFDLWFEKIAPSQTCAGLVQSPVEAFKDFYDFYSSKAKQAG
jgi:uncharacterized protein YeaO (DUF488 family)